MKQIYSSRDRHSLLERSWLALLLMAVLCCVLVIVIQVQLTILRPAPGKAVALREIVIPNAEASVDAHFPHYRFLVSQIVHRTRAANFFQGRDLSDLIVKVCVEEKIDPLFITAIIKAESTFFSGAVSSVGARGLMQIRSGTAQYISTLIDMPWQGERFLSDPEYNLRLGISYLKYLSKKFDGDIFKVLAAYNWGPGNVKKFGGAYDRLPLVTQKYVLSVISNHKRWKAELQKHKETFQA